MKKIIIVIVMVLSVTMISTVKVKAEDVTPTPTAILNPYSKLIVRSDGTINMSNVFNAYMNLLNQDQRDLANYLVGLSNYMYLTARGFKYETVTTDQQLVQMLCAFGDRFFGVVPNEFVSRLTPYMQNFVSACVSYAGTVEDINGNFLQWISNHQEDLFIPFTDNSLSGWTAFYNDPSTLGVQDFGIYDSPWVSGQFFDYQYSELPFYNSTSESSYNNFVFNNSPVIYTPVVGEYQYVISLKDRNIVDSLYILRSGNNFYSSFRYGYQNSIFDYDILLNVISCRVASNKVIVSTVSSGKFVSQIQSSGSLKTLDELITYAFANGPIKNIDGRLEGLMYYPYIEHVYLVDDLNSLSNKVEIFNTTDFNINGDSAKWIKTPAKGDVLYFPIGTGAILKEFPLPEYLKKEDNNGNLVPIDENEDLTNSIVNNTVINNYDIVAPGAVINVPVDWLNSEGNYLAYTNETALPFFVMVGDIFLALGELRIFIIACLILGLVGGILVKFLL